MVGRREFARVSSRDAQGQQQQNVNSYERPNSSGDIESGLHEYGNGNGNGNQQNGNAKPKPKLWSFKDAANTALEDARREELKKALLHGINRDELEQFRKSDEELKAIKNKKVRAFYEKQNDRLNDWLEVDAIVMAVADDVLESFDPDPDHDGINERNNQGLHTSGGNIQDFLPEEEKERRQKAGNRAKWAININVIANICLLIGKIIAVTSSGSLSLLASTVDSALDLLCTLIVWSTNRIVQWRLNSLQKKFPVGRRRLEPLGILVFSIIMVISFAQVSDKSFGKS